MKQKILSTLVLTIFIAMFLTNVSANSNVFTRIGTNDGYTPHEPIFIDGDNDFIEENGVTGGSGTQNDPFVIDNWNVSSIYITSTTKFFIINHCYVYDEGIFFSDLINGKVKDCTILNEGIGLRDSDNNFIVDCRIFSDEYEQGVCLINSDNNSIRACFISGLKKDEVSGIDLSGSNYNTIYKCNIEQCCHGIYLGGRSGSNNNIIYCCNISNCIGRGGIRLSGSKNNKIYHNNFFDNYYTLSKTFKIRCNAANSGGINQWDDGLEGNYWDNYMKIKLPILYDWNRDGIGNLPYRIFTDPFPWCMPSGNIDRHPLMMIYSEN